MAGASRGEQSSETVFEKKQRKFYRRSKVEVLISNVVHFGLLCFCVYVKVFEAGVMKGLAQEGNLGKGFPGALTFGGRWKYLTYINFWIQLSYFFLGFFVDIMPQSKVKGLLQDLVDVMFTVITFPMSMFVFISFWGIFAIDRELVYPAFIDLYIPVLLNHFWHSTIAVAVLIEMFLVYHKYPKTSTAMLLLFGFCTIYIVWIVYLASAADIWVYPFLAKMPPIIMSVFFAASYFVSLMLYFSGMLLSYIRYGSFESSEDEHSVKED